MKTLYNIDGLEIYKNQMDQIAIDSQYALTVKVKEINRSMEQIEHQYSEWQVKRSILEMQTTLRNYNKTLQKLDEMITTKKENIGSVIGILKAQEEEQKKRIQIGASMIEFAGMQSGIFAKMFDPSTFFRSSGGLALKAFKQDGKLFIKALPKANLSSNAKFGLLAKEIKGDSNFWKSKLGKKFVDEGIEIMNTVTDQKNRKAALKLNNSKLAPLNLFMDTLEMSKVNKAGKYFSDSFTKGMNIVSDFKGWKSMRSATTLAKVGKGLGIVGTVMTVGTNVIDDFYDEKTGKWSAEPENVKEFAVDLTVDITAAAGAMATGAAIGSLFLPPLGTAVGAVAGIVVGVGLNIDINGESIVDRGKTLANNAVDAAIDGIGKVGNALADIFW